MSSLAWIALEHGRDLPHLVQEHVTEVAVPVHNADLQARQATAALALEFAVLTFRDECTNFTNEVSETAPSHVIENNAEAAYRRGDLFDKRRKLIEAWAVIGGEQRGSRLPARRPVRQAVPS